MNNNFDDFDWNFYIKINSDLSHIKTRQEAINHYINKGKYENRIYKQDKDIDLELYKFLYDDLYDIDNNNDLIKHYYLYGKYEDRIINKNDKRYKLFHWKYYLENNNDITNNNLLKNKNLKDFLFKDYILNGIKENRNIYNFDDFDLNFYKNNYNLNIEDEDDIKIHYINSNNIFINSNIYNNYKLFNHEKYKEYYKLNYLNSSLLLYKHYLQNYKNGNIFFKYEIEEQLIKSKIGISVSIYINKDTPKERILCSKICINSILKECDNMYIIFVIDNCVTLDYLNYLFDAINNRKNIKVYVNKKNYGIAKTKNICMKLLEELDIKYLCILDDDVEIKLNFSDYIESIFNKVNNIPLLSNYNFELPYTKIKYKEIEFIKTNNYFGNFLVFNKSAIDIYGYMRIFEYKWGHEHIDITNRYLNKTKYKDFAIDLSYYINNFQIINLKNTLHLHSCNIDYNKANINKNILNKYCDNYEYVDFILDKTSINEITKIELNKINYINQKINLYNKIIKKNLKYNKYLKGSYWDKLDFIIYKIYNIINKDYNEYNNFNIINKLVDKINNYNINDSIKNKIIDDINNIKIESEINNILSEEKEVDHLLEETNNTLLEEEIDHLSENNNDSSEVEVDHLFEETNSTLSEEEIEDLSENNNDSSEVEIEDLSEDNNNLSEVEIEDLSEDNNNLDFSLLYKNNPIFDINSILFSKSII
jgi:hypothetical protein